MFLVSLILIFVYVAKLRVSFFSVSIPSNCFSSMFQTLPPALRVINLVMSIAGEVSQSTLAESVKDNSIAGHILLCNSNVGLD
jgi:hypothetical protein